MYRQSPNRNQRSKGIKVKHVLQICLLLAVCFWLIYQVKHSHDKKREFDENDAKASLHRGSNGNIIKLGRKDIRSQFEETISKNEKHDEALEEEETTGDELEENKPEEDGQEDEKVEKEDEGIGNGEDNIDGNEQEKSDAEVDPEEDFVDDEKEREDDDEKEIEEKVSEDGTGQMGNESSLEDADRDGDNRGIHKAREQNYKADDASSAVTHDTQISAVTRDTQISTTENENSSIENSNEHREIKETKENSSRDTQISTAENENSSIENSNEHREIKETKENSSEETNKGGNIKELEVEGGKMARGDNQSDVTTKENLLGDTENRSSYNVVTKRTDEHLEISNSSTDVRLENQDLTSHYTTESKSDLEKANNFSMDKDNGNMDSNSMHMAETNVAESTPNKFSNSSNNIESVESENIIRSDASVEPGNNTKSPTEKNDSIKVENSDTNDGTDEVSESRMTENPDEVPHDSIDFSDSSNSLEEKDVRTNLDALPETQTEGTNSEDAAAE